jgi:ATP-dependent helicase HepA
MLHESFPGLPEDGATVTFDRVNALAHEDREFLTWEHPMVCGAMDLLTGADLGSAALVAIQDARLKPGSVLLELIYIAECPAPPELQIGRFLPPTALRLLLDAQGGERGAEFPHDELRGVCLTRNRKLVRAVIKSQAERLQAMLARGEQLARQAAAGIEQQARAQMAETLDMEQARLRELAALNAGVRDDELEHLALQRQALDRQLSRLHLRLDAARLLVSH